MVLNCGTPQCNSNSVVVAPSLITNQPHVLSVTLANAYPLNLIRVLPSLLPAGANGKPVILSVSLELYDEPTVEPFTRIHADIKQILPILVYRAVLLYKGTVLDPALSVRPIVQVLK